MTWAERRLVRRLKERNEAAFCELIAAYEDRMFSLCYRMLGNRSEAEDLTQEVFISVFKSIDSFREDSKLSTWMYRIATNLCKNKLQFLSRRCNHAKAEFNEQKNMQSAISPQKELGPAAHTEGKELQTLMHASIHRLEEDHRVVIVLRDIEGLDYEEIVKITGLPEGTIKSRLHRARLALRKALMAAL